MKKKIILFGAGYYGLDSYEELKEKYEIVCFADNDEKKNGQLIKGIPVVNGKEISSYHNQETDIVITSLYHDEISKQLYEMGIDEFYIMIDRHLYKNQKEHVYRRCNRCVMDNTSDMTILFNEAGYCNYCTTALSSIGKVYFPNAEGKCKLEALISEIKEAGRNQKYDCVMGLSGGLDSSYLAYLGSTWGLRVLAIHIDDGYDTDVSKSNLKKLVEATGFDYEVIRPDKEQYDDLILAYMKAGVPNIAVPQDNVLFAYIYKRMRENNIRYFLSGGNFALECILQKGNTYNAFDMENLIDIHNRFGTKDIDKLEFLSYEQMCIDRENLSIQSPRPLNYLDYNRNRAFEELKKFCGFEYYGRKHLENILTAFIQLFWFPKKFKVDKRTSHLSSMIASGQLTREEAMQSLQEPIYEERMMQEYITVIKNRLKITDTEFEEIMNAPTHQHIEYRTRNN